MTAWRNEKIIHTRSMRDFLVENGGELKKTKTDMKDPNREIYIFRASTINGLMGKYQGRTEDNGEQ